MNICARVAAAVLALGVLCAPAGAQIASENQRNPAAEARDLRELVARYIAWRGGDAYVALQTVHERFYVETPAGRQPGSLWLDRDGRMRREVGGADGRELQVATPDGGWRLDDAGKVVDTPAASEAQRRWALIEFGEALTGRGGATAVLQPGTADFADHTWDVVRVTFGDADTYDVLLDPEVGFLCCYRTTLGGVAHTVMFTSWRQVDGVRMPFVSQTQDPPSQTEVGAIELNRPLDPSLFQRPAAPG